MKFSPKERERRADAALAEGRYEISNHYYADDPSGQGVVVVVNLFFFNIVNGRCDVCGSDKPGGEGCFSMTVSGQPGLLAILKDRANAEKAA